MFMYCYDVLRCHCSTLLNKVHSLVNSRPMGYQYKTLLQILRFECSLGKYCSG